jgi:hypothetical protein
MLSQTKHVLSNYRASDHCKQSFLPMLDKILGRNEAHGGVTEIRLAPVRPPRYGFVGYFRSGEAERLLELLQPVPRPEIPPGQHPRIGEANVRFITQPVSPALHKSSPSRFKLCPPAGRVDVVAYNLVAVSVVPAGLIDRSATDEERTQALQVARAATAYLRERGVAPVCLDAGNALQMLVATVPYRNIEQARANARTLLALLDRECATAEATIDVNVCYPNRSLALAGTLVMQGPDRSERPHRFVRVLSREVEDDIKLFELLADEIAGFGAEEAVPPPTEKAPRPPQAPEANAAARPEGKPARPQVAVPSRARQP